MAEAVLRQSVRGLPVASAGIAALAGRPADPVAVTLLAERGIDLSSHRARQLTPAMIEAAELVLVMERGHIAVVEAMTPAARGRVHLLGRFGRFEIPDPYRRPRAAFEDALALIDRGIADFRGRFWSGT
jgi:protein-tyrosine phosphatase